MKNHKSSTVSQLRSYIFSTKANWYWTIVAVTAITATLVFILPENTYPAAYARILLGSIFVLFLPGYSLIRVLFPTKELDNIERTALSVGMSLIVVLINGLFLSYTPLGIRTAPIILSLLILTTTFATAAVMREYQTKKTRIQ